MEHREDFQKLLEKYQRLNYIKPVQIPNIDLYMDQVTTFMEDHLSSSKRHPEDKCLTKTMINNYTKNDLLPPPLKKKYSEDHLILMIYIYYLKNILSIKDIETLLEPLTAAYFKDETHPMKNIYRETVRQCTQSLRSFYEDISTKMEVAEGSFSGYAEEDKDYLQQFALVSMLAFDVYMKKQMMENIIDDMAKNRKE